MKAFLALSALAVGGAFLVLGLLRLDITLLIVAVVSFVVLCWAAELSDLWD